MILNLLSFAYKGVTNVFLIEDLPRQQRLKRCLVKIVGAGQPLDFAYPTEAARLLPLQRPPAYWCWRPLGAAGWSGTGAAETACQRQHSGRSCGTGGWMGYGVGLHRPWMILDLENTIIWIRNSERMNWEEPVIFFPNYSWAAEPNSIPHPASVPARAAGVLMLTSSLGHPGPTPTSRGSWLEWDWGSRDSLLAAALRPLLWDQRLDEVRGWALPPVNDLGPGKFNTNHNMNWFWIKIVSPQIGAWIPSFFYYLVWNQNLTLQNTWCTKIIIRLQK